MSPTRPPIPRPIDRLRDSAGSASVPSQVGNIVTMKPFGGRLYFIGQSATSSMQMADQIDPDRQNINIPPVIQKVEFEYGADTPFVQRTICTAIELLDTSYLAKDLNFDSGLSLSLDAAHALAEISDTLSDLKNSENNTRALLESGKISLAQLPRTANLKGRIEHAITSLRTVQMKIVSICELFYPRTDKAVGWSQHLNKSVSATFKEGDEEISRMAERISFLLEISNYRNAVIHPDENKFVKILDYEISPSDGGLIAPTVKIAHPSTPRPRQDVVQFLEHLIDQVSLTFELMLAAICDRNADENIPGLITFVAEGESVSRGSRFRWEARWRDGYPKIALPPGAS